MGSAWSRKKYTIDETFESNPRDVKCWDLFHVRALHQQFKEDCYDFGMERSALRDLITAVLPPACPLTGTFWDMHVEPGEDLIYPLELFATLAFQCHGQSREKASFFFDLLDFGETGEMSYDEMAICISTVVGALSKVPSESSYELLDEAAVDKLTDDVYILADRDVAMSIPKEDCMKWIESRLKLDLSTDVTLDAVATSLGMFVASTPSKPTDEVGTAAEMTPVSEGPG